MGGLLSYPITRLVGLFDGLHDAALLVGDIVRPVGLARGDQDVGAPALDAAVQVVALLDLEVLGVVRGAAVAVAQAVLAVHLGVDLGEELPDRRAAARPDGELLGAVDKRFEHLPAWARAPLRLVLFFFSGVECVRWCLSREEDGSLLFLQGPPKVGSDATAGERRRLKRGAGADREIRGGREKERGRGRGPVCVRERGRQGARRELLRPRWVCVG